MKTIGAIFAVIVALVSVVAADSPAVMREPKGLLAAQLGNVVTLNGWAWNLQGGAFIQGKDFDKGEDFKIWIDGIQNWPVEFAWKQVSVTGVVIDRPIFKVPWGGNGRHPMPPGFDLRKASHRYFLKDAKWKLHEPKH